MTESRDELARRALRQAVAYLVMDLETAIDREGLDADALYDIAGLWAANKLGDDFTLDRLVRSALPTRCDDCGIEVTPHNDDGFPIEDRWDI